MKKLSKISQVELRDIWKNETTDFTTWLCEKHNLNLLGRSIGLDLSLVKKEASKGTRFRVDILAKDNETDDFVIIENQLEETDHSHLGQIVTYASIFNSNKIIWIVKDIRPEYELAINWLNNKTKSDVNIYLVRIELLKIGNSLPAPCFKIISKPHNSAYPRIKKEIELELNLKLNTREEVINKFYDPRIFNFFEEYIKPSNTYLKSGILRTEIGLMQELHSYNKELAIKYDIKFSREFSIDLFQYAEFKNYTINESKFRKTGSRRFRKGGKEYYEIDYL